MKQSFLFVLLLAVLTFACSAVFVACETESADTHTLTHVEATDATCTEDGNTEYWVCSDCGKYFSDADATTEISQSDTVIPAKGHSYGEWTTVKDATCTEDGTRERECTVCNEKEQETVSATGHTFSDDWSYDDTYHWHAATCGDTDEVIGKAEHTWDNGVVTTPATCTEDGVLTYTCTVCGKTRTADIPATGHTFSDDWSYDDTYHWHACLNCEEVSDKAGHTWDDGVITKQPTCTENGVMTYTCTVCEKTRTEAIQATGHTFSEDWSGDDTYHWHDCINCDEVNDKADHSWDDGVITKQPTCTEDGVLTYTCTVCGKTRTADIPATGHTFSEDWSQDDNYHWHDCLNCDEVSDKAEHTWENGVCSVCGIPQDLAYELNNDGTAYSITGIGTYTDTDVVIPSEYNGLHVTSIGASAFKNNTSITSVILPDSVTSIGNYAFDNCTALESVTLGNGVTSIGSNAFYGCSSLTSINIPDGVISIGYDAFCRCTSLTSVTIPDSVTSIGVGAFYYCTSLTSINIPDGVTSIGSYTFYGCTSLKSVTTGSSVISIGDWAFSGCASLTSVTMGSDVTSIGDYAFYKCTSLTSITIPDSVTSIGANAFYCSSLKSVTFENTSGWYVSSSSTATSGEDISSEYLADPAIAAAYLRSAYYNYYWHRS